MYVPLYMLTSTANEPFLSLFLFSDADLLGEGGYTANSQLATVFQEKSNDVDPHTEQLHLCQHSHFCPAEFSLVNDEPLETHSFPSDKVRLWEQKLPSTHTQRASD